MYHSLYYYEASPSPTAARAIPRPGPYTGGSGGANFSSAIRNKVRFQKHTYQQLAHTKSLKERKRYLCPTDSTHFCSRRSGFSGFGGSSDRSSSRSREDSNVANDASQSRSTSAVRRIPPAIVLRAGGEKIFIPLPCDSELCK